MSNETELKTTDPYGLHIDTDKSLLMEISRVQKQQRLGNCIECFPVADVKIPSSVIIACPKLGGTAMTQARECQGCSHFKAVVQSGWCDEYILPWDQKFGITCDFPIDRKCVSVVSTVK